jgi:hypothetical protein
MGRSLSKRTGRAVKQPHNKTMQTNKKHGFIDDYRGLRISPTGKRFRIEDATVSSTVDRTGLYCGQAAAFYRWSEMSCENAL